MRLLLDTHALIWWSGNRDQLPADVVTKIEDATSVFISPISVYEMELKYQLGKLPGVAHLLAVLADYMKEMMFKELPLTLRQTSLAGRLPLHHRDPFDRMLVAQSMAEELTIVSKDDLFDTYGIRRLW